MPDPISPLGSPGQFLVVAPAASALSPGNRATPQDPAIPVAAPPTASLGADRAVPARGQADPALEGQKKPEPDKNTVEHAVESMREFLKNLPSNLEIRADKETGYITYKVVNPITKEVIRQYPPDEMVELAKKMRKLSAMDESGILLDRNL